MEQENHHQLMLSEITSAPLLSGGCGGSSGQGSVSGFVEERVKVDRKRFEQMLSENSTMGCDADSFFRRVMKSTNTQIMWPPKLKPGTKSKKDPHVRITGSPNSINAAKEIIFEQLDTRRNRVTLKMDVAFTDHSHIIGKGGRSIQRVMDETGCHIHFPDSNRTNTAEKSNQVSIAGSAEGVEQSRCRIREMLPLTLQFDLPLNNGLHSPPTLDPQSPQLQAIQQTYGITITFRCDGSKCSNNSYFASSRIITVAVRGARSHLFGLRQGLSVLIEYLTGFRANTINVPLTMTIDVAIQHHSFIAGRLNCNLRSIMQATGAVISMPDLGSSLMAAAAAAASSTGASSTTANINSNSASAGLSGVIGSSVLSSNMDTSTAMTAPSDNISLTPNQHTSFMTALTNNNNDNHPTFHGSNPNLTALGTSLSSSLSNLNSRKTAIVIRGPNFDSVYNAWQELLGHLPLILIFDLKEGQDLDPVQVTKLMEQMRQISILIKPKQRQNTKSIVVRGPEKDSRLLFEVRKQILRLDDSEVPYQSEQQQTKQQQLPSLSIQQPTKSILKQQHHNNPQQVLSRQGPQLHVATLQQQQQSHQQQSQGADLQMKAIRAILEPNLQKVRQPTPYWAGLGFSKSVSEPMIKEKLSVGPLFSSNLTDERRISYSNEGAINGLTSSLQSLQLSGQQQSSSDLFTNLNSVDENCSSNNSSSNMNLVRLDGNNANQQTNCNVISNLFDKKPAHISNLMDLNNNSPVCPSANNNNKDSSISCVRSSSNDGSRNTGYVSSAVNNDTAVNISSNQKVSACLKLAVFLGRIGLVQYLGLFTQHNIDLELLLGLSESDFGELGLPYVHRRKLAIAIAEVKSIIQNEQRGSSTFDAAPGAERSRRYKVGSSQGDLKDVWPM